MNVLYIAHEEILAGSGISKKIMSQCKGLSNNGANVFFCHLKTEKDKRSYVVDDEIIEFLGKGLLATYRFFANFSPILSYIKEHHISCVYIRYNHVATPFYLRFLRKMKALGVIVFMEIPTYPYDAEHANDKFKQKFLNCFERFSRKFFKNYVDRIVTVQEYDRILGVPTIKISNGVDIEKVTLRNPQPHTKINFLGIANMKEWHGYDRLIEGIGLYYKNGGKEDIHFYLVGDYSRVIDTYRSIVNKYELDNRIHFEGSKQGRELDAYFDIADLAIGSLGFHRIGLSEGKPLKCIEYAARGIPFIYSNINLDFDDKDYVMRVSPDEKPIPVIEILDFLRDKKIEPSHIRESIDKKVTWNYQMSLVIKEIENILYD